jgi:hypothetical protein
MSVGEHRDTRVPGARCGGRALCGWSPPSLAADTDLKRRVDLIRLGNVAAIGIVVVVVDTAQSCRAVCHERGEVPAV